MQAQGLLHSRGLRGFATTSRVLAASYSQLGKMEQAKAAVAEMLDIGANERTVGDAIRPFRLANDRQHYAEGLRKAGLPDH